MYDGSFPKLTDSYFSTRLPKTLNYDDWDILESFKSERSFEGLKETKTVKLIFECINTLWFCCFEIFSRNAGGLAQQLLYDFGFDKLFNMESDGEFINLQVLSSASFLVGLFGSEEDFKKINRKFKSQIKDLCAKGLLISQFYSGLKYKHHMSKKTDAAEPESQTFEIPLAV